MSEFVKKSLGDVCDIIGGGTPSKERKDFYGGEIPWATVRDMSEDILTTTEHSITQAGIADSSTRVIPKGSVVIASRVGLGKVCLLAQDTAINQDLRAVLPKKSSGLLPAYLFHWFKSVSDKIIGEGTGATVQGVKLPFIKGLVIPIPPVEEQERIVALIESAAAKINSAQTGCSNGTLAYREYLEAEREAIFTAAAENYCGESLSSVLDIARGGSPRPINAFLTTSDDGINWVKISDATKSEKYIYFTDQKIKPEGLSHSRLVQSGDFLLSNSMSFGRPYIMRTTGAIHDGWLVLRDTNGRLNEDYLYYLLGSAFIYREFNSLAAGSTVRNLNISLAGSVKIPVPPLDEQIRIAARIAECERAGSIGADNCEERWLRLSELRQAVLHKAFAGDL